MESGRGILGFGEEDKFRGCDGVGNGGDGSAAQVLEIRVGGAVVFDGFADGSDLGGVVGDAFAAGATLDGF